MKIEQMIWKSLTDKEIRSQLRNGDVFLMKSKSGAEYVCEVVGNLPGDERWKAQRRDSCVVFDLMKQRGSRFIIL